MLALGEIVQNRYQITGVLGSGGFSTVYLANDLNLIGTEVAVKTMSLLQVPSEDRTWAIEQFRHEALLLSRLDHPGIVRVSDFFNTGNDHYLVMEYVRAETLAKLLTRQPGNRLLEREALDLVTQLATVLEFLHGWIDPNSGQSSPIIFRDIKPANIMVLPNRTIKLIDFGTARFFKPGKITDTQKLGTPGYASPEHYGARQTDERSDVYSLGVLLHEMVTGHDPSQSPFNLPDAKTLNPTISARVAETIHKATNLNPADRYANISTFCLALGVSGPLPPSPPSPYALSKRNLGIFAIAVLLLVCLTGTALATAPNWMPPPLATQVSGLYGGDDPTSTLSPTATEQGDPSPDLVTLTPTILSEENDVPTISATTTVEPTVTSTPVTPTSTPSSTPVSRDRIAFVSHKNGLDSIYVMDVNDPSGARQLTYPQFQEHDWWPAWCGNSEIVFERAEADRDPDWQEIVSIDLDTGDERTLTSSRRPSGSDMSGMPACSPDGRYLALSSRFENPDSKRLEWLIGMINRESDSFSTVNGDQYKAGHMSWSPDGDSVVFMHFPVPGESNFQIYQVDLNDPSSFLNLTQGSGYNSKYPTWSPDSDEIAYACGTGSGSARVWSLCISRADRAGVSILLSKIAFGGENEDRAGGRPGHYITPSWSPDGRYITFSANDEGSWDIYTYEMATGYIVNLTNSPSIDEMHPVWSW